jgi:hypothetical protein
MCESDGWKGFVGWVGRLNAEKNEKGYLRIEVRPEGYMDRLCSDITLNRRDMRSKFGYIMLYAIDYNKYKI